LTPDPYHMPTVRVLPDDIVIGTEDGQTIMDAAHDGGLYWPTTCGGEGICTTCACTVDKGLEHLDPMGRGELKTLSEDRDPASLASGRVRLACQARVRGDVTVTKRGVRPE
jgi:ferredoxin, 2Fe-2S